MMKEHSIDSILEALFDMYPECQDQHEDYAKVIETIQMMQERTFEEFVIKVGLIDPSGDDLYEEGLDEDAYLSVAGYSVKEDLHFALGFAKWEEWANASILIEEDLNLSEVDIIAICVYEMTFYGFDQDEIKKELEALESGITNEMYH